MEKPEIKEIEKKLLENCEELGYVKDAFYIEAHENEEYGIRVSKFFGKIPCFEDQELPKCQCGNLKSPLVQIYVPSLPAKVRALFPSDLQDALIVMFICVECLQWEGGLTTWVFHEDEIDKLLYKEGPKDYKTHVISGYHQHKQIPSESDDFFRNEKLISSEFDGDLVSDARYSFIYKDDIGSFFGGFPFYCQGDDNPGRDYKLILSLVDDKSFPFMWGDAGNAQIWLKNDDSHEFLITWACC